MNFNRTINLRSNQIVVIILVFSSFLGCSKHQITGSNNIISEIRNLAPFHEVSSLGPYKVIINKGEKQKVEVFADDNIIEKVKTNVRNGKLTLRTVPRSYRNTTIKVHITLVDLNKIENYSSGNMFIYNHTKNFSAANYSSGDIYLEGTCNYLNIQNYSSGKFLAYNMQTKKCSVKNSSSGDIQVNCKSKLDVGIYSNGDVYYRGNPSTSISTFSSGKVYNDN